MPFILNGAVLQRGGVRHHRFNIAHRFHRSEHNASFQCTTVTFRRDRHERQWFQTTIAVGRRVFQHGVRPDSNALRHRRNHVGGIRLISFIKFHTTRAPTRHFLFSLFVRHRATFFTRLFKVVRPNGQTHQIGSRHDNSSHTGWQPTSSFVRAHGRLHIQVGGFSRYTGSEATYTTYSSTLRQVY